MKKGYLTNIFQLLCHKVLLSSKRREKILKLDFSYCRIDGNEYGFSFSFHDYVITMV